MALRSDLRTRIRDDIYESAADLITDAQLNRYIAAEINSLPSKQIFLKKMYTTTTVVDQYDYALPTGTVEVEKVERNDGTTTGPVWTVINGCQVYDSALHLPYRPGTADTIRVHIQKTFTNPDDDATTLDIPDDKLEVVVQGCVVRAYRSLVSYLRQSISWDSVTAPRGVTLNSVQQWYREAKEDYKELVKQYQDTPLARDIDLTG